MPQSILFKSFVLFFAVLFMAACAVEKKRIQYPKTDLSQAALIPKPVKTIPTHSAFGLDKNTLIFTDQNTLGFEQVGQFLAEKIKNRLDLEVAVNTSNSETVARAIYINQTDTLKSPSPEAYQLLITNDTILLNAKTAAAAFRGVQTLRQLIPETANDNLSEHPMWLIPSGKIEDAPQLAYRSAMLDVARHFFTVDEVKKYLDILAYYKYNTFHMHLSDDQGWRIEIKSWPKLTEVGAQKEVGGGQGGFYTQEDFEELVRYAAERHIQIVPEIDMPGHTNAASFSYPFLNGNGKTLQYYTGTRVGFSTFDAKKDTVYAFLDDVIGEIAAISPSPYFHIGGDESHVTKKRDYINFVERVEAIVNKHGKTMVGWEEIIQADLEDTAVIQFWRDSANALLASKKSHPIIFSPAHKAYLDMKYDSLSKHGLNWAAYIPVDAAYNWNPVDYMQGIKKEHILGIEAPLWSETISNSAELEYLAFPRAIGYAELGWTRTELRNWGEYRSRLARQTPYLERMNINFYPSQLIDWPKSAVMKN